MTSPSSDGRHAPDLIAGVPGSFCPIGPAPAPATYTAPVRPVPAPTTQFRIRPAAPAPAPGEPPRPSPRLGRLLAKRKNFLENGGPGSDIGPEHGVEPVRKVHLNEDVMAANLSNLYISHPRPKVARRNLGRDVAEATNLTALGDLEDRFHHQAAINNCDEHTLPPQRTRKLPNRSRVPQLRLSLHQDLNKHLRSPGSLPESLLSKYRPAPRTTALVLWKPPGGVIPDLITSALRSGAGSTGYTASTATSRSRIRCYSEVTSTPYSSAENLTVGMDNAGCVDMAEGGAGHAPSSQYSQYHTSSTQHSPTSAEAPELSYNGEIEVPAGLNLQRRNSAPEISEPLPFVDEGCMEL